MKDCPSAPLGFVFGKEKTLVHIAHRIAWENWAERYQESIGHRELAEGHANASRAYCKLLVEKCEALVSE